MPQHPDVDHYLDSLPDHVREIAAAVRPVLDAALPGADARIWHGHPVWMSGRAPLAGFKAYTAHVTLMIWHGAPITDRTGRLRDGAHMSTVKLASTGDVDVETFVGWVATAHVAPLVGVSR